MSEYRLLPALTTGWVVQIDHGAVTLTYGPYPTRQDAETVAAHLVATLQRERLAGVDSRPGDCARAGAAVPRPVQEALWDN